MIRSKPTALASCSGVLISPLARLSRPAVRTVERACLMASILLYCYAAQRVLLMQSAYCAGSPLMAPMMQMADTWALASRLPPPPCLPHRTHPRLDDARQQPLLDAAFLALLLAHLSLTASFSYSSALRQRLAPLPDCRIVALTANISSRQADRAGMVAYRHRGNSRD
jgi:hypothetical protein